MELKEETQMELLTIEHKDFTMIVECTKFDSIWNKAKSNVGEDKLYSTYSLSLIHI